MNMTKFVNNYLVKIKALKLRSDCRPFFCLRSNLPLYASFPWKLNGYSYGVQFGINCNALDQSKLSNFVECTIMAKTTALIQFYELLICIKLLTCLIRFVVMVLHHSNGCIA